jgi:hypothetical protein
MHSRKRIRGKKSMQEVWKRQAKRLQAKHRATAARVGAIALVAMAAAGTVTLLALHSPVPPPTVHPRVDTHEGADVNVTPTAAASPSQATAKPRLPVVTVTGCLVHDDDVYRLKEASGAGAPKARSWKSGFLKKGPAPIEIADSARRLRLSEHVGQRVSITGTLKDREMDARSLQRLSASCESKAPSA